MNTLQINSTTTSSHSRALGLHPVAGAYYPQLRHHSTTVDGITDAYILHQLRQLGVIHVTQQRAVKPRADKQSAVRDVIRSNGGNLVADGLRRQAPQVV